MESSISPGKLWIVEFGYSDRMEGQCCVAADSKEEAIEIAKTEIPDSEDIVMQKHEIGDLELDLRETWPLSEWQQEFGSELDEEYHPAMGEMIIFDFGT